MKAKELAELLLQTPDANVYIEILHTSDWDDNWHETSTITGVQKTPSGIFLKDEYLEVEPRHCPSTKPVISTVGFRMKDGKWFPYRNDDPYNIYDLIQYKKDQYLICYGDFLGQTYILTPADNNDEYIVGELAESRVKHYTPEDIDYVEVLVGIDEETWVPVTQHLTLSAAISLAETWSGRTCP